MLARLRVSRGALRANYRHLVASAQGSVAAVVKADAYGIGADEVVATLLNEGCDTFFVATADEAFALRRRFKDPIVYVFSGVTREAVVPFAQQTIRPLLNTSAQVDLWLGGAPEAPCGLQVDSGMARLGFDWRALDVADISGLNLSLLVTHFARADEPQVSMNASQLARFQPWIDAFPGVPISLGNSAAGLSEAIPTQGLTRAGIALYGGNPFATEANPMQPVVALEAQVLQVRPLQPGDSAGYGATWVAAEPTMLAVIGIGYADGIPRQLSNHGQLFINGKRCPVVGRVSMDMLQVAVPDEAGQVSAGDWVELIGQHQTLDAFADAQETIPYEVLTRLGPRVGRCYEA